jgi:putative flippase GtrA
MKLQKQFLLFCAVGVAGLAVDISVLYALAPELNWYLARLVSFVAAATTTWALNRKFTFEAQVAAPWSAIARQYVGYLSAMVVGGTINYACYVAVMAMFTGPAVAAAGVAVGSVAGLFANFALARQAVFRSARVNPSQ